MVGVNFVYLFIKLTFVVESESEKIYLYSF